MLNSHSHYRLNENTVVICALTSLQPVWDVPQLGCLCLVPFGNRWNF